MPCLRSLGEALVGLFTHFSLTLAPLPLALVPPLPLSAQEQADNREVLREGVKQAINTLYVPHTAASASAMEKPVDFIFCSSGDFCFPRPKWGLSGVRAAGEHGTRPKGPYQGRGASRTKGVTVYFCFYLWLSKVEGMIFVSLGLSGGCLG